ncbi:MAG: DUF2169 domain-containing protein [Polyangiaceae bacterium]
MQLVTRCPLRAASILWLPKPHAYALTVVCKATFELSPGVSRLSRDQEPPAENDVYLDDDEARSLDAASDLVPFKRHPEVLVVGHAHAPQGAPVTSLVARLTIAEVDKAIEITGDRFILPDGSLSAPARFTKMPLRWERAAGGPDTENPVGIAMGADAYPDLHGRIRLPNLAPRGRSVREPHDVVEPIGFGPISPRWPSRAARLHRHAATFRPDAWHVRPLPAEVERAFFNAAPLDQGLHELVGTERLILENLHPEHALLRTRLPRIAPRATVDWGNGAEQDLPLVCDTLLIDADRGLATLTFRGTLALDVPERAGWIVITSEDGVADEISVDTAPRAATPEELDMAETYAGPMDGAASVLPFLGRVQPAEPPRAVTPFAPPAEAPRSVREPPTFGAPPLVDPPRHFGGPVDPPSFGAPSFEQTAELSPIRMPDAVPPPAPVTRTLGEMVAGQYAPPPVPPPMVVEPPLAIPLGDPAAPPPIIGSLARLAPAPPAPPAQEEIEDEVDGSGPPSEEEEDEEDDEDEDEEDDEDEEAPAPEPPPPPPREVPLAEYPLERCARIAARVARRKSDRADILKKEDLTSPEWESLSTHWNGVVQDATTRGKTKPLDAWDEAYVAELEVERGAITVEEYASLIIASERNTAESRLADLGLPRGSFIRIRRVWGRKMRADTALAAQVRAATEAAASED